MSVVVSVRFEIRCASLRCGAPPGAQSIDSVVRCFSLRFGAEAQFGLRVSSAKLVGAEPRREFEETNVPTGRSF